MLLFRPTPWGFAPYRSLPPKYTGHSQFGGYRGLSKLAIRRHYHVRHVSSAPAGSQSTVSSQTTKGQTKSTITRKWILLGSFGGLLGALFTWDHYFNARTLSRNTRTIWNGIMLVIDYK